MPQPLTEFSSRFRIKQFLPVLEREGIEYVVSPFVSPAFHKVIYTQGNFWKKLFYFVLGSLRRLMDLLKSSQFDCIFLQREAYPFGPALFERLFKIVSKKIVYDFDDALFVKAVSKFNRFIGWLKSAEKISQIIALSDYVIAGNSFLYSYAKKFNSSVTIIPTCMDTDYYTVKKSYTSSKSIKIGWIGSHSTVYNLSLLSEVLQKLSFRYPVSVKIVGANFELPLKGVKIESVPWDGERELEYLKEFDIGIMPMLDNIINLGKCGCKALQYMAVGTPAVASPVGVAGEIIEDGVSGFLCNTPEEWIEKLTFLIEDESLRKKIGLAGRERVERFYSVKAYANKFLEVLCMTAPK